jgi:acetyl-CoA synthetase
LLERFAGWAYDDIRREFFWDVPSRLNIGVACCDRHPAGDVALIHATREGDLNRYRFGDLSRMSNGLANALQADGVTAGDRVAVVLPQSPETAIAHLAIYKLGAVAVPLSSLFGPEALEVRLRDSGARAAVVDETSLPRIEEVIDRLPDLERFVVTTGGSSSKPSRLFRHAIGGGSAEFTPARTGPDSPALLIYTSGTTGGPKGALHGHRVLLGHLPGFELSHSFFPQRDDLFWTPADWAWIGGLVDALLPTLYFGRPILVADSPRAFDPEWALHVMAEHAVRNTFLPPTALKLMRQANVTAPAAVRLRTMMSGGEPLGEEMLDWVRGQFRIVVNEIFGQTECNYIIGNSADVFPVVPGSMGKAYPGHDVAVLGDGGRPVTATPGEIAVRMPDPVAFLGYWNNPEATQAKYQDGWLLTGDHAEFDERGYFRYLGRRDDLINSAGYRIGPTEIEACLIKHPAVALAAVIGVPDAIRGEVVKACVLLRNGFDPSEALAGEIQWFVKERLAAYEYPRVVEFVTEMPLTSTGKIRRNELRMQHSLRGDRESADSATHVGITQ